MKSFAHPSLTGMFSYLASFEALAAIKKDAQFTSEDHQRYMAALRKARDELELFGLHNSVKYAVRVEGKYGSQESGQITYQAFRRDIDVLRERMQDELDENLFLFVQQEHKDLYENPKPFGDGVATKFSAANFDIEEAGKCFALDRYTACVMHLMRALEVALDAVGLGVGVPNAVVEAHSSWERLLEKIRRQIETNDKVNDPNWTPKRQFFVDSVAHLFAVKNAWRNPSMHLENKYAENEAERIYRAVKDFMGHLATHLDASGQFTP